jgi:hypothetical protein
MLIMITVIFSENALFVNLIFNRHNKAIKSTIKTQTFKNNFILNLYRFRKKQPKQ